MQSKLCQHLPGDALSERVLSIQVNLITVELATELSIILAENEIEEVTLEEITSARKVGYMIF